MNINLGTVRDGDYLPVGVHSVYIYGVELDEDQSGRQFATYTFKGTGGQTHRERYYLNEESLWKFKRLAVSAGIQPSATITPNDLTGKRVTITLSKREYNGKSYTNIERVEPCAVDIQAPPEEDNQGGYFPNADPY